MNYSKITNHINIFSQKVRYLARQVHYTPSFNIAVISMYTVLGRRQIINTKPAY